MPTLKNILRSVREKRYNQDFEQIKKIGRGGYASVYKSKNVLDDQYYAVKKIKLTVKDFKNNIEDEIERVLREVKVLAKVNHPNILRYYNSWLEVQHKNEQELERPPIPNPSANSHKVQDTESRCSKELDEVAESSEDDSVVFSHEEKASPDNKFSILSSRTNEKTTFYDDYGQVHSEFERKGIFLQFKGRDNEEENCVFRKTQKKTDRRNFAPPLIMSHISKKSKIQERFDEVAKQVNEQFRLLTDSPPHDTKKKNKQLSHKTQALADSRSTPMKDKSPLKDLHSPPLTRKKLHQLLETDLSIEVKEASSTFFESIKSIILYIQTELCKNTLEDYITKRNAELHTKRNCPEFKSLKERAIKKAVKIALQIVNGLDYIHNVVRIVHRDLKPGNILMTEDNVVKICDFGLVKKMKSFSPLEPSPMISRMGSPEREESPLDKEEFENFMLNPKADEKNCEFELKIGNNDQLSCDDEESLEAKSHESLDSPKIFSKNEITREVGTKTFASPEQLAADVTTFDERV